MATHIFSQRYRAAQPGDEGSRGPLDPRDGIPYSHLDVDNREGGIEHVGTRAAIERHGIPVPADLQACDENSSREVVGTDGHTWRLWSKDMFFIHAMRPRTEDEETAWIDSMNARIFSSYFSKDRQLMCYEISWALWKLAASMRPDRPMARAARRKLRRMLEVVANVQMDLTGSRRVDMADLRRQLAGVGLVVRQQRV